MKFNQVLGERETFGFQNYDVVPDVVVWQRNGGGMPVGALPHQPMMDLLSDNPKLGHITTLGHPVSVSLPSHLQEITETDLMPRT
jgi:acetylornithine aminotransferase